MAINNDEYCFACGEKNPWGLHLKFEFVGDKFVAKKILPREFESYAMIVHGGIVTTMLDESMGSYINRKYCEQAMTGRLEVRYHYPTPVGQELTITAWEESQRKNIIVMRSTVATADGVVTAEATAKFAVVKSQ